MTPIAIAAAISAFLAYFLRRTSKPEDTTRVNIANALSFLTVVLVGTYFYLRFAT